MAQKLTNELVLTNSFENIASHVNTFYSAFGWDLILDDLIPSAPLAAGTWCEQIKMASALFDQFGIDSSKAIKWHSDLGNLHENDPPVIRSLRETILSIRQKGFLVAVCTSDDRHATDAALLNWDLMDLIDVRFVYFCHVQNHYLHSINANFVANKFQNQCSLFLIVFNLR